jgi:hypothetical protein
MRGAGRCLVIGPTMNHSLMSKLAPIKLIVDVLAGIRPYQQQPAA